MLLGLAALCHVGARADHADRATVLVALQHAAALQDPDPSAFLAAQPVLGIEQSLLALEHGAQAALEIRNVVTVDIVVEVLCVRLHLAGPKALDGERAVAEPDLARPNVPIPDAHIGAFERRRQPCLGVLQGLQRAPALAHVDQRADIAGIGAVAVKAGRAHAEYICKAAVGTRQPKFER